MAPTTRNSENTRPGTAFRTQILPAGSISNTVNDEDTVRLIKVLLANFGKHHLGTVPIGVEARKRSNRARLRANVGSLSSESSDES